MKVFKVLIVEDTQKDADRLADLLTTLLLPQLADKKPQPVESWVVSNQADADKAVLETGPAGLKGFDLVLLDLRYPEVPNGPVNEDPGAEFQGMKWLPKLRRATTEGYRRDSDQLCLVERFEYSGESHSGFPGRRRHPKKLNDPRHRRAGSQLRVRIVIV